MVINVEAELAEVGAEKFTARDYRPGLVKHIVLLRFRADVAPEQRAEVSRRFHALQAGTRSDGKPYVLSMTSGPNLSPEGAHHDFDLGFIVEFASIGDRNYYAGKPFVTEEAFYDTAHDEFKEFVSPLLREGGSGVLVFDFQVP